MVSPQQLFGTRLGEHVPRFSHVHQLLLVLGVAHLTSQLSAFVSMRIVLRNLLQPFLPPFLVYSWVRYGVRRIKPSSKQRIVLTGTSPLKARPTTLVVNAESIPTEQVRSTRV